MKRLVWIVLCVVSLAACVESSCPQGSTEVSGRCQSIESIEDGGGGGMPDAGSDPDGGETPALDASTEDGEADAHDPDEADAAMVDPCELLSCGDNAHCENVEDEARCVCNDGYEGDGATCEVDPCAAAPCDAETSTCKNEDAEAVCECLEGFARCDGDAFACTTDLQSDAAHCGACDAACAGNLECMEGACEQLVAKLSLGLEHSCALAPDGEILCWGSNEKQQLQRADPGTPEHEPGATTLGKARALSANVDTSCALMQDSDLVCWGSNDPFAWLGAGGTQGVFRLGEGLVDFRTVSAGTFAACAIVVGEAHCWGLASPIATGGSATQYTFANRHLISLPREITQLSTGYQTCAVTDDGRVSCWGYDVDAPVQIEDAAGLLSGVEQVAVSAAAGASCAVLADGRVMCWGANDKGQLGNVGAAVTSTRVPKALPVTDQAGGTLSGFVQVATGIGFGCARKDDGTVMCWGQVDRLGNGGTSSAAQSYATAVREIDDALEIAVGGGHACVARRSGQVQCWGDNNRGQLGVARLELGGIASSAVPVNVAGLP